MGKARKKSFTLVELIIVVAIIGILMGMILPAVSKVKAFALSTSCKNNLRELGVAVHAYIGDSAGYLPCVAAMPGVVEYEAPYQPLVDYLKPYAGNSSKVFRCQADGGSSTDTAVKETYYDDSGIEHTGTSTTTANTKESDFAVTGSSYEFNEFLCGRRMKMFTWAMLLHDYRTYHGMPNTAGAMNYLFEDGHVGDFQ